MPPPPPDRHPRARHFGGGTGTKRNQRIAEIVGCGETTLYQWAAWFREAGLEGLLSHANGASGGKEPRFNPEQWERFRAELAKGGWRTARDAQRWLEEVLGLVIAWKEVCRPLAAR